MQRLPCVTEWSSGDVTRTIWPSCASNGEVAAHAAIRTDRIGAGLAGFVPRAGLAHVVFGLEHQRAGGTDADAVAAIHAGGIGQRDIVFGGDVGGEAASGDGDGEGVLRIHAASFHALVAENALGVIAHVEVVIDLDRLGYGRGGGAETLRLGVVALHVGLQRGRGRHVHRGSQEFEHDAAAEADALGIGVDHHAGLDFAGAGRNQRARSFELDDAHAAHIHRREAFEKAERGRVDAQAAGGVEDGRAFGDWTSWPSI